MTPIILEALEEAVVVSVIVALLSVCAKAVEAKPTILATATSSMADRIIVDAVLLDVVIMFLDA
jgi:hypothetical protein